MGTKPPPSESARPDGGEGTSPGTPREAWAPVAPAQEPPLVQRLRREMLTVCCGAILLGTGVSLPVTGHQPMLGHAPAFELLVGLGLVLLVGGLVVALMGEDTPGPTDSEEWISVKRRDWEELRAKVGSDQVATERREADPTPGADHRRSRSDSSGRRDSPLGRGGPKGGASDRSWKEDEELDGISDEIEDLRPP